jgi:hypothetical protein
VQDWVTRIINADGQVVRQIKKNKKNKKNTAIFWSLYRLLMPGGAAMVRALAQALRRLANC